MAKWILLNTTKFKGPTGPVLLDGGKTIDDTLFGLSQIQAAGGVVVPFTDALAATAATLATKRAKQGLANSPQGALVDLLLIAAVAGEANASAASRKRSTRAAGATVAAAAAIVPAIAFTPTFSGKVLVRAWCSVEGLASGTFTPVLNQGSTTIAAPAQYTGLTGGNPDDVYVEVEVTGLTLGTPVTFNFVTTTGDATVTLGNGSTGIAASMEVIERP